MVTSLVGVCECDTVSGLNGAVGVAYKVSCTASSSGKTRSTSRCTLRFIVTMRPSVSVSRNTKALFCVCGWGCGGWGGQHVKFVVEYVSRFGFFVVDFQRGRRWRTAPRERASASSSWRPFGAPTPRAREERVSSCPRGSLRSAWR